MRKDIKKIVKNLIEITKTKNIYELCYIYNISILFINIEKKGVFFSDGENDFIFISNSILKNEIEKILLHEFAHFILHKQELI